MDAVNLWIEGPRPRRVEPDLAHSSRVRELIVAFAERHVALTPELANALAAMESSESPVEAPIWGAGFRLAGGAVGQASVVGRGRFWCGAAPCFVSTVAEPLLREAMISAGGAGLPGAADLVPDGAAEAPDDWRARLGREVERLLSDEEVMGQGFWIEAALRLYGAALRDAETRAGRVARRLGVRPAPPEPEPVLCRLIFEAEPVYPEGFRIERRHRHTRAKSQRKRAGVRPKEGGVSGIRTSTAVDDLPDALLSELVLPPELVMDRLLHEGMLVRHRPPYRQPKRDMLVMGLADRRARTETGAAIKAAWCDAALRLQMLLAQMGLAMSDLVWSEATAAGSAVDLLRAEEADLPAGLDPLLLEGRRRAGRLYRSGLMPSFIDTLAGTDAAALDGAEALPDLLPSLAQAGVRRLRTRHRAGRGHIGPRPEMRHRPSDYARRVAIVSLGPDPALTEQADRDWTSVRSRLGAALRRTLEDDVLVLGVAPPPELAPGARFVVLGEVVPGGREEVEIDPEDSERAALEKALGALSAILIRSVLEAADG